MSQDDKTLLILLLSQPVLMYATKTGKDSTPAVSERKSHMHHREKSGCLLPVCTEHLRSDKNDTLTHDSLVPREVEGGHFCVH